MAKLQNIVAAVEIIKKTVNFISSVSIEESLSWDILFTTQKALKKLEGTNVSQEIINKLGMLINTYVQTEDYTMYGFFCLTDIARALDKEIFKTKTACFTNWTSESRRIRILRSVFDYAEYSMGYYNISHNGKTFIVSLTIPEIKIFNSGEISVIKCKSPIHGFHQLKHYIYKKTAVNAAEKDILTAAEAGISLFNTAVNGCDKAIIKTGNYNARKVAYFIWNTLELNEDAEYWRPYCEGDDPFEDYGWVWCEPIHKTERLYESFKRRAIELLSR